MAGKSALICHISTLVGLVLALYVYIATSSKTIVGVDDAGLVTEEQGWVRPEGTVNRQI